MSWIDKILPSGVNRSDGRKRASVPEGVWTKCIKCEAVLYKPDLERNANVCPKCEHHMRLGARKRLDIFLDKEDREEVFADIEPIDRLRFRDKKKYVQRLAAAQKSTGERDALVAMRGSLHGMPVVAVAFEFSFHGGSMGQAVGEKFSRAAQLALKEKIPLICFAASGGARMQEALISLMQMAKTSAVIERMHSESIPYVSVLTDPIYGGVSASLALLGDLNIAEPDARAGFAGPNIIEQTIRQKLPKGFQRSEFLLEHGAIDMIVSRLELRDTIARLLAKLSGEAFLAATAAVDLNAVAEPGAGADEQVDSSDDSNTADEQEMATEDDSQASDGAGEAGVDGESEEPHEAAAGKSADADTGEPEGEQESEADANVKNESDLGTGVEKAMRADGESLTGAPEEASSSGEPEDESSSDQASGDGADPEASAKRSDG
ncbi:MAG: hypothetical protein Cons2KO_17100 [Congregibacter sp.]